MKVYCEHGAFTSGLRRLQREGRIEIIHFPYEQRTRRAGMANPSEAAWHDLGQVTWNELDSSWDDFSGSDKCSEIERIIGRESDKDIKHVDSAYRNGCRCFFTTDKRDILSKRSELEALLGIRFFHPEEDWQSFLIFLAENESAQGSA